MADDFLCRPNNLDGLDDSNIQRRSIDVSDLIATAGNAAESPLQEELQRHLEENPPEDDVVVVVQTNVSRKKRYAYSKLSVAANRSLYILEDKLHEYDNEPVDLIVKGMIDQVAAAKNDWTFKVSWYPPVGTVEVTHLRQYYTKSEEICHSFQEANVLFRSKFGDEPVKPLGKKKLQTCVMQVPAPFDTPDRQQKAADLRTSGTIFTSGTLVGPAPSTGRSTRNSDSCTIESKSEDGDDLDERDNAWSIDGNISDESTDDEEEVQFDFNAASLDPMGLPNLLKSLVWKFKEVLPNEDIYTETPASKPKPLYDGPEGLKAGVAASFSTPTECFAMVGGFDYHYVSELVGGTNDYYRDFVKPTLDRNQKWNGLEWSSVTITEMYKFLGILLRISISPVDDGGYESYFSKNNKVLSTGFGLNRRSMEIPNSSGFAHKYMQLKRFKQIRGAFHPENREQALGGDKCYQLRKAINRLNAAAMKSFDAGRNLTFDEGGVSCHSRFCPVRQYNKDKPNKFRVDFFILSGSNSYIIHHLDVYQGANPNNACVNPAAKNLPPMQKCVVNAILQSNLHVRPIEGMRHLFLDNRYQCAELAVLLRDKMHIYSTGTTRVCRKGWPKELLNMPAGEPRGNNKLAWDKVNKLLMGQWSDSKVVKSCTSLVDTTLTTTKRWSGKERQRKEVECMLYLTLYHKHMFGVDKGDQIRAAGGGFANKAHFKKWYKRIILAIFDCQLLNSLIGWNMSADEVVGRSKIKRHDFLWWISEDFLNFEEKTAAVVDFRTAVASIPNAIPSVSNMTKTKDRCQVCLYESKYLGDFKQTCTNVGRCPCCGLALHYMKCTDNRRMLQNSPPFNGMTCHEIAHSKTGKQIWLLKKGDVASGKRKYELKRTHHVIQTIDKRWVDDGWTPPNKTRRNSTTESATNSTSV